MAIKHFLILYMDFGEKARRYHKNRQRFTFWAMFKREEPFYNRNKGLNYGVTRKGKGWVL